MKTAGFRMAFVSGLMELACSGKRIQDGENKTKEEEQPVAMEEKSATGQVSMDEPETQL